MNTYDRNTTLGRCFVQRSGPATSVAGRWVLVGLLALSMAGGCSESTGPSAGSPDDGVAIFDGSVDPGASSFVLQRIEQPGPPGMAPVRVELIGSNLRLGEAMDAILLDVAVRNVSAQELFGPAWIWVHSFQPPEVTITNADEETDGVVVRYGFDYSEHLGPEGVLVPGATSKPKTWAFHDPGLRPFSFGAEAQFSLLPDRSHIAGIVFIDDNFNGVYDPQETPVPGVVVELRGPGIEGRKDMTNDDGRYRFFVERVGLYSVHFRFERDVRCGSSPNPLSVLLTPGPNGRPLSYEDADYWFNRGCVDSLATNATR